MTAWPELKEKLLKPVKDIWDVRTVNCLTKDGITFVGQIYLHTEPEFMRIPNFGKKCLLIVKEHLEMNGMCPTLPEYGKIPSQNYAEFAPSNMAKFNLNGESDSREVLAYYHSEHFAQMRVVFEQFLEKHKEYFQLIADPNGAAELELEKEAAVAAKAQEDALAMVQYPSTQDWILQHLPSELREGLKPEFLDAVVNSPEVRAKVQQVVSEAVAQKLGFDFKG